MPQSKQARPIRFLDVQFTNEYGQKEIVAHVMFERDGEVYREGEYRCSREAGPLSGPSLEDLVLRCYVGHGHDPQSSRDGAELWGWGHEYKPFRVRDTRDAERIYRTFKAIDRVNERLYRSGAEGPASFGAYLRRMAGILGATEIRFWIERNGARIRHLSRGYGLEEGAALAERIAETWGRSHFAQVGGLVEDALTPPAPAEEPAPSPLDLTVRDTVFCVVCKREMSEHEHLEKMHRWDSPGCFDPETIAQARLSRAS